MGYSTDFYGQFEVVPPLSESEIGFLNKFAETRRCVRADGNGGKYFLSDGTDNYGQDTDNILDHNTPPEGQPSLWCMWEATKEGNIRWNGCEKFKSPDLWLVYLNEHFLKDGCLMEGLSPIEFKEHGLSSHKIFGTVYAKGEEPGDVWKIVANEEGIFVSQGKIRRDIMISKAKSMVVHGSPMSQEDIEMVFYEAWADIENIDEASANWGEFRRCEYNPPASDVGEDKLPPPSKPKLLK